MTGDEVKKRHARLTARGAATRERIVSAASDLMYVQGVNATNLDDVMTASGTGKSQLYHYFADKDALVKEVVRMRISRQLAAQEAMLQRLDSMRGLERWCDAIVIGNKARQGAYGCPLGSLAGELADQSEEARAVIAEAFATWESYLSDGLARMRDKGELAPEADPAELAVGIMAALQGGYLLAQTTRDSTRMEIALDMALGHVRAYVLSEQPSTRS